MSTDVVCFKKVHLGYVITIGNDTPWNMLIDNTTMLLLYAKSGYNARRKLIVYENISMQAFPGDGKKSKSFEAFRKEIDR